jgi:hypothetical protein
MFDSFPPKTFHCTHYRILIYETEQTAYVVEPHKVSKIGPVDYDIFRRQCVKYLTGLKVNMAKGPNTPDREREFSAIVQDFSKALKFWTVSLLHEKVAI